MALSPEERIALLEALRANGGRLASAIETAGLDAAEVLDVTHPTGGSYDAEFSNEVVKLERVRLLAVEEVAWRRAEAGGTGSIQEINRLKNYAGAASVKAMTRKELSEINRQRHAEANEEKAAARRAKKQAAKGPEPDPVAAGAARVLALTSGRGQ